MDNVRDGRFGCTFIAETDFCEVFWVNLLKVE